MLEFREYSGYDNYKVVYDETTEIGILSKRKNLWVFVPDPYLSYYYQSHLEQLASKLKELNG